MILIKSTVFVIIFVILFFPSSAGKIGDASKRQNVHKVKANLDHQDQEEKTRPLVVMKNSTIIGPVEDTRRTTDHVDHEDSMHHDLVIVSYPNLDSFLFVSTLEGRFYAVNKHTGEIKWILRGEPVLRASLDLPSSGKFLPDPRDGTLYMYQNTVGLKKMPFTIPELVAASPSRSSDGILYTGYKRDTWYAVDPYTGFKQQVMTTDDVEDICPSPSGKTILIGRTEYTISMYDSKTKEKKWNATFMDYSTHSQIGESDMNYFASCSDGVLVSLQPQTADVVWIRNFHSPVVAMYSIESEALVKLLFTTVAPETLRYLTGGVALKMREDIQSEDRNSNFYSTLYIGEYKHSMYALPSIVDESVAASSIASHRLMIEGPAEPKKRRRRDGTSSAASCIFGFHRPPKEMKARVPADRLLENHSDEVKQKGRPVVDIHEMGKFSWRPHSEKVEQKNYVKPVHVPETSSTTVIQIDLKFLIGFVFILAGFVLYIVMIAKRAIREVSQRSNVSDGIQQSHSVQTSVSLQGPCEDLLFGKGFMRIGKIVFDTKTILGHGCEGTIVYRGKFDGRDVAVKRLLPECYSFADREVELLRESDLNPNVIRYFCMEQDHQFRYIALELCMTTLHDYIENDRSSELAIKPVEILKQAMSGMAHLHRLKIVHRDCKPHNVLITLPDALGRVRALISDFGLCKKLGGRHSLSRRSGIAGTEGWMAPEQLNLQERTSTAMDIFSAGCVVYYVLSKGSHPFGDKIHRQSNILRGEYNLPQLDSEKDSSALDLVSRMIQYDQRRRPTAEAVLKHPFFWSADEALSFYSDVSDRIEKEQQDCKVLAVLEHKSETVVRDDWRSHICEELQNDLRKFRSYRGTSVRDLLRALRNKKHHFRECSENVQRALGFTPEDFYLYFANRFPLLLMHTYNSLKCCHEETSFRKYYDVTMTFDSCENCMEEMCYTHGVFGFESGLCCEKPKYVPNGSPRLERKSVDESEPVNLRAEAMMAKAPISIFDESPKRSRNSRYRNHRRRNTGQTTIISEA